ncbi:S-glutathionyl-(chloro)hydroquinone reductase [Phlyctochytrium bullatum]|nr:S-glutathionyl-(chloro)hydroquinone reductase [Phlyctochytrium bullatum]
MSKDTSAAIYKWSDKDSGGEFRRQVSSFRDFVGTPEFPAEKNRYHLYVSLACPWAHRTLIFRALKGLEDVISVSVVDYYMTKDGWHFSTSEETPGAIPDSVNGAKFIREIYFKANPNYGGRFTVPVLWDKKNNTIVNNESSEIIRMFNTAFNEFAKRPSLDLYPEDFRKEIDDLNGWGFATTQEAYERNVKLLFEGLDRVETILDGKTWLVGNRFTEIAQTVDLTHIKRHYYLSHIQINPFQIVPAWNGPVLNEPKYSINIF